MDAGSWGGQREFGGAESLAGHLLPAGSVFAFLAEHGCQRLFPDEGSRFPSAVTKLRRRERLILNFPARTRDFCFVDDVVSHLADLLETPQCGATFREVGTGTGLTLEGASRLICESLGAPPELVSINPMTAPDPSPSQVSDASSPSFLGSTTSFQDGIDTFASRLIAHGR